MDIRLFLPLIVPALLAAQGANLPALIGPTMSATPFTVDQKFDFRIMQSFGLRGVMGAGLSAFINQERNSPPEWGQGVGGYATRFASGFGSNLSRQSMSFALESALREDPRYFPSREKDFKSRVKNALLQTLVTRTDSGGERFAFSRIASAFGTGQLVNAWVPSSNSSIHNGIGRSFIMLAGDAGYNLLQEFVPFTRPRSLRR